MINCTFEDGNQAHPGLRHVVVDALVIKGDKILLVKRAARLQEGGKWGLVGGFVDRDETIHQAVERETLEETGWKVTDITLLRINDNPNPTEDRQNIKFVIVCKGLEKVGEPDDESEEQKWFALDALPADGMIAFDHGDYINLYKKYLAEPFTLPQMG